MDTNSKAADEPVCWTIETWTKDMHFSRGTYFNLSEELRPAHTKIGKLVRITESPTAWLERIAARGGLRTTRAAA